MKIIFALALLSACAPAVADTAADIAAQEARIAALRKEVEPLVAPLQTIKSDVRVFASFGPIVAAVAGLNGLPAAQRRVSLQSTAATGHFYENNDLCNSYVELQGPGDLHASGELTAFNAATQEDGSLLFTAHAATTGHVQAHWHFYGVRVRTLIGNACPPGGGFGGSIGADFRKDLDFKIRVGFAMTPDGKTVSYQASVIEPRKVNVTVSLGVQRIGNVGFPTSFDVPGGAIASGQFPLLIANGGKFVVPGEKGPREYALTLKPASFAATKAGVAAEWTSAIDFKTPAPTR